MDLLSAAIEVSHKVIPLTGTHKKEVDYHTKCSITKNIPGWRDHVQKQREDSIFWHSIWLSCGLPDTGVVHSIMARTRNVYHFALRRVKKLSEQIQASNLLDVSLTGDMR